MAVAHHRASVKNSRKRIKASMPASRHDVVISGASFAGLTLAVALRKAAGAELNIAILDTGPAVAPATADPRAFALSAASVHLLTAIDVWQGVCASAQPVTAINISASRLTSPLRQTRLNYDNQTEGGEPASFILPAEILRKELDARAGDLGLPVVRTGTIRSIEASLGSVAIGCADGRQLDSLLLVAADGRRSPARDLAGIKTVGWTYPQTAIVTTVKHSQDHRGIATQHFLEAGPFAILPLAGGYRSSLVWSEERQAAARIMALGDAQFLAELEQRFGGILGEIALDGPRVSQPLEMHLARSFVANRFAVIGDAARGVHPLAGQGLNLSLRDVAALTEVVTGARRLGLDLGSPEALARYERWRRFDSVVSAAAMDGLNRLFSNNNPILRTLREAGLGLTDRLPGLKRLLVSEAAGLTGSVPKLLSGELP